MQYKFKAGQKFVINDKLKWSEYKKYAVRVYGQLSKCMSMSRISVLPFLYKNQ